MSLPITREQWRILKQIAPTILPEEWAIQRNAQWLIEHLYKPVATGYRLGPQCPDNIAREPVNWGDLDAVEVVLHDDGWMITLEEASPGACPNLCEYVRSWLETWGWKNIVVVTEW